VKGRLESVDHSQRLLLEAVDALQCRVAVLPAIAGPEEQERIHALEEEIRDALRWTRANPDMTPFAVHPNGA
jgi:cytosine/adenosine deaminase-related metal-dependent hydrolase